MIPWHVNHNGFVCIVPHPVCAVPTPDGRTVAYCDLRSARFVARASGAPGIWKRKGAK